LHHLGILRITECKPKDRLVIAHVDPQEEAIFTLERNTFREPEDGYPINDGENIARVFVRILGCRKQARVKGGANPPEACVMAELDMQQSELLGAIGFLDEDGLEQRTSPAALVFVRMISRRSDPVMIRRPPVNHIFVN